jgi:lysozyme
VVVVTVYGIDVSANQGHIDWPAVARSGIHFAVARCVTEPDTIDPTYAHNVAGARAAGLIPGAYAFLTGGTAASQAAHFIKAVGNPSGMLVMLDVERPTYHQPPTAADVRAFAGAWRKARPTHPLLIYGSRGSVLGSLGHLADLGPLWLAGYPLTYPGTPAGLYAMAGGDTAPAWSVPFGGWKAPTLWQFTSQGRVPGIIGNVDVDAFRSGRLALLAPK